MKYYADKYKISSIDGPVYEYEVLNELKDKSSRTDVNCLYHTRFLFEIDSLPLEKQLEYIEKNKQLINRCTFSGKKSYHTIIEFSNNMEPLCAKYYKEIWKYINKTLFDGHCDTQCNNPSRLTRKPNVKRKDTGKMQEIYIEPKIYIDNDIDFFNKLTKYLKDKERVERSRFTIDDLPLGFRPKAQYSNDSHDGMCANYEPVKYYMNNSYPKTSGNGDSSISLFKALRVCIKYKDNMTMNIIIGKAINEHWTHKEIDRMIKNIKEKYI